jgi:hypothetical protein
LFLFLDKSSYASKFEGEKFEKMKNLIEIKVQFSNESLFETYLLDTKEKTLTRKGIFPQPEARLKMKKKD